jgi:hypothetical protein
MSLLKSKGAAVGVAAAFILTAAGARLFSLVLPWVHWEPIPGLHIHHYVYGIFILTAAGYLALVFKSDRATLWIALLYGLGVGLTFDEFGMWLNPPFQRGVRWSTNGLTIVIVALVMAALAPMIYGRPRQSTSESHPLPVGEGSVRAPSFDEP